MKLFWTRGLITMQKPHFEEKNSSWTKQAAIVGVGQNVVKAACAENQNAP